MKSLNLQNLTPSQRVAKLNRTVRDEVGWEYTYGTSSDNGFPWKDKAGNYHAQTPPYAESADAILKLFEEMSAELHHVHRVKAGWVWEVAVYGDSYFARTANAATLPEAACISFLRAKGWEVVT